MTATTSREPARPQAQSAGSRTTHILRAATVTAIVLIVGGTTYGTRDPACVLTALTLMPFLTRPRTRRRAT